MKRGKIYNTQYVSDARIRYLWRTKYPWILVVYILGFGLLIGLLKNNTASTDFNLNVVMFAVFASYIFLYVFYVFGVRPIELEHHFHKK